MRVKQGYIAYYIVVTTTAARQLANSHPIKKRKETPYLNFKGRTLRTIKITKYKTTSKCKTKSALRKRYAIIEHNENDSP